MSKQVRIQIQELTARELLPRGYRRFRPSGFRRQVNPDVIAYFSFHVDDTRGKRTLTTVNPSVAVRHEPLERCLNEVLDELGGPRPYRSPPDAPTLTTNIVDMMPQNDPLTWNLWEFDEGVDNSKAARSLIEATMRYGEQFISDHSSLLTIAASLLKREAGVPGARIAYLLPLACYLIGEYEKSEELLRKSFDFEFRALLRRRMERPPSSELTGAKQRTPCQ